MLDLLCYLGSIILDVLEFFFQRKKRKRRKYEEKHGLPKKKMTSPKERLLIILGISVLVFLILIPITKSVFNNHNRNTVDKIGRIKVLLEREKEFLGDYPVELKQIIRGNPVNSDLREDSWGNEFKYQFNEKEKSYLLVSSGKDGKFDTEDDIK